VDFKFYFWSFVEHTWRLLSGRYIRVVELTQDGAKWNEGVSETDENFVSTFFFCNYCTSQTCIVLRPCFCIACIKYVEVQS